jgi:two-component system, NtrC family, response regulator GlrR
MSRQGFNSVPDQRDAQGEFATLKLVGTSPAFIRSLRCIKKVAQCDVPVLIEGEIGTGKEVVTRAIHYNSTRHAYPFIPINCGTLPDNLIENELFGHEQGAFTDARRAATGLIAQAEGGTLFLDEVETLSLKGQVVLLRFLEEQEYRSLGGKRLIKANVRVIAASNVHLADLVAKGSYRQDLLFRLNILFLHLPPLRERTGDIELLAEYFLNFYRAHYREQTYLHPDTLKWMRHYPWPGNVRELENLIHREFLLAEGLVIRVQELVDSPAPKRPAEELLQETLLEYGFNEAKTQLIEAFEKRYLHSLMRRTYGNVTLAAKSAGKERRALGKLLKKHGINPFTYR